ncbi:hypothetical protein OSTOST_24630, partial [Ostertagia ostertagi]
MQKRARAVESQKLRRTMKGRGGRMTDPIRDSESVLSCPWERIIPQSLLELTPGLCRCKPTTSSVNLERRTDSRPYQRHRIVAQKSIATPIIYVRLMLLWIGVISLDMLCGFRFELLYPFWLILRTGYEAVHKNHNAVVTLANHNTA